MFRGRPELSDDLFQCFAHEYAIIGLMRGRRLSAEKTDFPESSFGLDFLLS
jgi:hypothetical protein